MGQLHERDETWKGNEHMNKAVQEQWQLVLEFTQYLKECIRDWLAPVIGTLLMLGTLGFFLEGSALAPAIYSIF